MKLILSYVAFVILIFVLAVWASSMVRAQELPPCELIPQPLGGALIVCPPTATPIPTTTPESDPTPEIFVSPILYSEPTPVPVQEIGTAPVPVQEIGTAPPPSLFESPIFQYLDLVLRPWADPEWK